MSTGWNYTAQDYKADGIINLLGNEYWLEHKTYTALNAKNYKPTGK